MTLYNNSSTFLNNEQEAFWFLGGQKIIDVLKERMKGMLRLTEFVLPTGMLVYPHLHQKEDEALYVIEGEVTVSCKEQHFSLGAGSFLFLPCNIPHHMQVGSSGPLRYLTWMTPMGFAQDVVKVGCPENPLLLAPLRIPDSAKVQHLASLLRGSSTLTSLEDLRFVGR